MDNFEKKIGKVISVIFEGFIGSEDERTKDIFGAKIKDMVKLNEDFFTNLDEYDALISYKLDDVLKSCLKEVYPNIDRHKLNDLYFIYKNYKFLDYNIKNIVRQREGGGCSSDKSSWLVNSYKRYILEGTLPNMEISDKCYWKPEFGTGQQWIDFCKALERLYYGYPEEYLKSLKVLINTGKDSNKKAEEILKISDEQRIIISEFLQWNDKNGCFTDQMCKSAKLKPFGKKDMLKIFFNEVNQDFLVGQEVENPLNFYLDEIIKIAKDKNVYFSTTKKLEMLFENNSLATYEKIIKLVK